MAITRLCIYTRISTDEENQPTSLHSQRERLEAFCTAQDGWRIVAHKQDKATGTKLDRPGLQAALDLARSDAVDMLLVYRVDRLSRKVRQLAQLTEELDALGVVLKSATEPFDTGAAAGRMMLQMLAVFAEFEHATSSTASAPASNDARRKAAGSADACHSATRSRTRSACSSPIR
jgi:site-specific DNA recombinase